jgi:hypothetical protein
MRTLPYTIDTMVYPADCGEGAYVDCVIWKNQDDDCTTHDFVPTLFQAIRKLRKAGRDFILFDGHNYFVNGTQRVSK